MLKFYTKIKMLFFTDHFNMWAVHEFAHANKDLLVIVCDPKTDKMSLSYGGKHSVNRIKSPTGKKLHVVKNLIKASRFDFGVDSMIASVAEALHVRIPDASHFFKWLDGAAFNIAKSLREDRRLSKRGG